VPCALSVRRREQHTGTEESLDEATNSGRVGIEAMTGKKGRGCETMCAELLGDSVELGGRPHRGQGRRGVDGKGNRILILTSGDL
jgi:hypothetical protein